MFGLQICELFFDKIRVHLRILARGSLDLVVAQILDVLLLLELIVQACIWIKVLIVLIRLAFV